MSKIDLSKIILPKIIKDHKGRLFQDMNKIFCSYKYKNKEYLSRVLMDNENNPRFIMSFNFCDDIMPDELDNEDSLSFENNFISKDAYRLWKAFLYPVTMTEIKRLSDKALIKVLLENSYDSFDCIFL